MDSPLQELREFARNIIRHTKWHKRVTAIADRLQYQREALLGLADHMEKEVEASRAMGEREPYDTDQWIAQIRGILR